MAASFGQVVRYKQQFGSGQHPAVVVKVNAGSVDLNVFHAGGCEGERTDTVYHAGVVEGTGPGQYSAL